MLCCSCCLAGALTGYANLIHYFKKIALKTRGNLIGYKKRRYLKQVTPLYIVNTKHYFLCLGSLETVNLCLPLALLRASTFLPLADAMRSIKPCLFLLFLFDG